MLTEIGMIPYVTKLELYEKLGISTIAVDNNIAFLRKNGYIERIGKTKGDVDFISSKSCENAGF